MDNKQIIARKYAKAFLNLYLDKLSIEDFNAIKKIEQFFYTHKKVIFFLSIPNIKREEKEKALSKLFAQFDLQKLLEPLIRTLCEQKRLFLIDDILKHIRFLYKERNNIMMFIITSSHELNKEELEIIEQFLEHETNKTILYTYALDKNLVAGIRLQSDTLLWEYSINKQCETLRKQFNIQEAL